MLGKHSVPTGSPKLQKVHIQKPHITLEPSTPVAGPFRWTPIQSKDFLHMDRSCMSVGTARKGQPGEMLGA